MELAIERFDQLGERWALPPAPHRVRWSMSAWSSRAWAAVRMDDGTELVMEPGDLFAIPAGHDSWVVGGQPYVSVHLQGASTYATPEASAGDPR